MGAPDMVCDGSDDCAVTTGESVMPTSRQRLPSGCGRETELRPKVVVSVEFTGEFSDGVPARVLVRE